MGTLLKSLLLTVLVATTSQGVLADAEENATYQKAKNAFMEAGARDIAYVHDT